MATRKQRRRREKSFRHEYSLVEIDEEGNETPVERVARERAEKKDAKPARGAVKRPERPKRNRPLRPAPPPTWRRAAKRGGMMGAVIFVLFVFVLHGGSEKSRAIEAVVYAILFIPVTYWADRLAYRTYLRRSGLAEPVSKPKS
jgi:hypothetical protein